MKDNVKNFLQRIFPFMITVGLWRLSGPWWNPGGILAIIPIFFCTFVRPTDWFVIFSVLMCVLIDYNFETVCFWLAMYCLIYSVNGFQNFVDIKRMDFDGINAFMIFIGLAILIQILANFTWVNIVRGMWIFAWTNIMYIPITTIIKKVHHD